jgi:hypothetical protein
MGLFDDDGFGDKFDELTEMFGNLDEFFEKIGDTTGEICAALFDIMKPKD